MFLFEKKIGVDSCHYTMVKFYTNISSSYLRIVSITGARMKLEAPNIGMIFHHSMVTDIVHQNMVQSRTKFLTAQI